MGCGGCFSRRGGDGGGVVVVAGQVKHLMGVVTCVRVTMVGE